MDAARRIHRRTLPNVSGRTLSGVIALVAVLGFGTASLPSLLADGLPDPNPLVATARTRSVSAGEPDQAPIVSSEAARPDPGARAPFPPHDADNAAPSVEQVRFAQERLTSSCDLRLRIQASDPDGDPLSIRTTWIVDGHELEMDQPVLERSRFSRGSRVQVSVIVSDGHSESPAFLTNEIVVVNAAPHITTFPTGFDATGSFVYPMGAIDPDGDRDLEFRLVEGPPGMRLDAHEGVVAWMPASNQSGTHLVRIEVRDAHGGQQSQSFDLHVRDPVRGGSHLAERGQVP